MKRFFKSIAMIAAAALTFAACSQEDPITTTNGEEMINLKFKIGNSDNAATRALLNTDENGKKFLKWENGDKIGSFAVGTFGTTTTSNNNGGTVEVNGEEYTLNIQTFNTGSATNIYTYFPYSSNAGKNKESATMTIPGTQYIDENGFDADAMPMAGEPVEVDLSVTAASTDVPCGEINFYNLGSIIDFRIYSSVATDEKLTSVKYIAEGNIAGAYTIDLTKVSSDPTSLALGGKGTFKEITTIVKTQPAIGTGKDNAIDVYMVIAPGEYSNTQIVVSTDKKTYTLNASGAKTYNRSSVKPMSVDIQKGTEGELPKEEEWVKVTNASDFTPGTYYIVNWDESKYLANIEAGSAPAANAFTGTVTDDMRWTAIAANGGLTFKNPESELYLWGQDDSNNGVRVKKYAPASSSANVWKFTTNADFGVIASVGTTRYLATYNNNGTQQDWRNYIENNLGDGTNTNTSGNVVTSVNNFPAVFYKLVTDEPAKGIVSISFNDPNTLIEIEETVTNTAIVDPEGLTVTYSSSDDNVATVDAEGTVTGVSAGAATITASFAGNDAYYEASASYDISVYDPNGNDGSANNPYTASEAAVQAAAGSTDEVYVKGIISSIVTAYSAKYGNVSFNISDDGSTTGSQFQIFRATATSADDFKVGDGVLFKGNLKDYNSGTYELEQNTLITKVSAPVLNPDGGSASSVTITADAGATIRYTTDGSDPNGTSASVYSAAIPVTSNITIKAIATKDGISTAVVSGDYVASVAGEVTATYIFNTDAGLSALGITKPATGDGTGLGTSTYTIDGVSLSATDGNTATRVYNSSGNLDLRIYKNGGTLTFSVASGKKITSIVLKGSTTNVFTANVGTFNSGTWTGEAQSVKLTATGTGKISTIEVTYN